MSKACLIPKSILVLLPQIGEKATLLSDQWKHNGGAKADAHSATLAHNAIALGHNAIAYRHQCNCTLCKSSPFSITYTCLPSPAYPPPPPFNTRPIPPSCLITFAAFVFSTLCLIIGPISYYKADGASM